MRLGLAKVTQHHGVIFRNFFSAKYYGKMPFAQNYSLLKDTGQSVLFERDFELKVMSFRITCLCICNLDFFMADKVHYFTLGTIADSV